MKGRIFIGVAVLCFLVVLVAGCGQNKPTEAEGKIAEGVRVTTDEHFSMEGSSTGMSPAIVKGQTYQMRWQTDENVKKVNVVLCCGDEKTMVVSGLTRETVQPTLVKDDNLCKSCRDEFPYMWEYSWTVPEYLPSSADTGQFYHITVYNGYFESLEEADKNGSSSGNPGYVGFYMFAEKDCPRLNVLLPEKDMPIQYGNPIPIRIEQKNLKDISIRISGTGKDGFFLGYVKSEWIPVTSGTVELEIKDYTGVLQDGRTYQLTIIGRTQKGINSYGIKQLFSFVKFF